MLTRVAGKPDDKREVRLRILGPSSSMELASAFTALGRLEKEAGEPDQTFIEHWKTLIKLRLISPQATAPARVVLKAANRAEDCRPRGNANGGDAVGDEACIDMAFKNALKAIKEYGNHTLPFFSRTIGTDDALIALLGRELCARGLAEEPKQRVVLLQEWDSPSARSFAEALKDELNKACLPPPKDHSPSTAGKGLQLELYTYLRGLDGAKPDGAPRHARLVQRDSDKPKDERKEASVEWAEGRGQRDYVRRLVQQIKDKIEWRKQETQVKAIGLVGSDLHDKLILAQALRASFPDRTMFTTDLDVRLLHPEVAQHTRNLIVASSLPLEPEKPPAGGSTNGADGGKEAGHKTEPKVAPFRDLYQTSSFLAARLAAADPDDSEAIEKLIKHHLGKTWLFEIGRDGALRLGVDEVPAPESARRIVYALLMGALLAAIGGLTVFAYPGPAMRFALTWRRRAGHEPFSFSAMTLAGLQAAAFGFALGVVVELSWPGSVGAIGAVLLAVTALAAFLAVVYPGISDAAAGAAGPGQKPTWNRYALRLAIVLATAAVAWLGLVAPPASRLHEPFALANGVSTWPSELLRVLVIVLFAWFLDRAWCESAAAAELLEKRFFPPVGRAPPPLPAQWWKCLDAMAARWQAQRARRSRVRARYRRLIGRLRRRKASTALARTTVWFWRPDLQPFDDRSVKGLRLCREYRDIMRDGARACRVAIWVAVLLALIVILNEIMGDDWPEIPARGLWDRDLFRITVVTSVGCLIVLLVVVCDATIGTWRFVRMLKNGRTIYPQQTVAAFASRLGPAFEAEASKPVAAQIADRKDKKMPRRNSLLDDWIDAHLLAEHTEAIGKLIVMPFILAGLLVISRSRVFDNWEIGGTVFVIFLGFLLSSVAMAALLNISAETARRKALERMREDQMWLEGAGKRFPTLGARFGGLVTDVEKLRAGAFAPFFEQPLVRAMLVPLGGAGGIQLLELVMLAKS
jgi:hypothetical protein